MPCSADASAKSLASCTSLAVYSIVTVFLFDFNARLKSTARQPNLNSLVVKNESILAAARNLAGKDINKRLRGDNVLPHTVEARTATSSLARAACCEFSPSQNFSVTICFGAACHYAECVAEWLAGAFAFRIGLRGIFSNARQPVAVACLNYTIHPS